MSSSFLKKSQDVLSFKTLFVSPRRLAQTRSVTWDDFKSYLPRDTRPQRVMLPAPERIGKMNMRRVLWKRLGPQFVPLRREHRSLQKSALARGWPGLPRTRPRFVLRFDSALSCPIAMRLALWANSARPSNDVNEVQVSSRIVAFSGSSSDPSEETHAHDSSLLLAQYLQVDLRLLAARYIY